MRPEGLRQRKNPRTPSGIEPANSRVVAQFLNQIRHSLPPHVIQHGQILSELDTHFIRTRVISIPNIPSQLGRSTLVQVIEKSIKTAERDAIK
jgi:hypothetical protein